MTLVSGSISPRKHAVRMEFWRVINLFHVCSYVLADKTRKVYNTDKFLVPAATAYGEWDGVEKFGMLRAEEIDILSAKADVAKALPSLMMIASEAKKKASCDRSLPKHPSKSQIKSRCLSLDMEQEMLRNVKPTQRTSGNGPSTRRAPKLGGGRHMSPGVSVATALAASVSAATRRRTGGGSMDSTGPVSNKRSSMIQRLNGLANSRGDVSSQVAYLHAALGVRMYMLVGLVTKESKRRKISPVAWPAWNAVCIKLRSKSHELKHRALFRLPRIYQMAVRFLVTCAVVVDTFLLASHSGRALLVHALGSGSEATAQWRQHVYMGALVDFVLNMLFVWCVAAFINAIEELQTPFGSHPLDLPALSYVTGTAELSLRMTAGCVRTDNNDRKSVTSRVPTNATSAERLFALLNGPLDEQLLCADLSEDEGDGPKFGKSKRTVSDTDQTEDHGKPGEEDNERTNDAGDGGDE